MKNKTENLFNEDGFKFTVIKEEKVECLENEMKRLNRLNDLLEITLNQNKNFSLLEKIKENIFIILKITEALEKNTPVAGTTDVIKKLSENGFYEKFHFPKVSNDVLIKVAKS